MAEKKEEFCTVLVISADAPEDAAAASGLRKRLEQFRLPSYIRNTLPEGKKTIRALSAEGPDAAEAEESSQWLTVICSPRLKDSDAAMGLIRRFKKQKGQERILAVLLEGEPADSFPKELCFRERTVTGVDGMTRVIMEEVEPLAADLREKDPRKQKKLLDDAVLRLAAPVFSLNYDDLRQRHREKKLRRIAVVCGAAVSVSFVIACTALYLSVKVSRQNRIIEAQQAELEEQYRIQQEKYKESMLTVSEELLEKGRQQDAVYAVRGVLPGDPAQAAEACTPDMQAALASALYVYNLYYLREKKAEEYEQGERLSTAEITEMMYGDVASAMKGTVRKEILSDDGKYTVRLEGGRSDQALCFYETGSTELARRLYGISWITPVMKKLEGREGYLLITYTGQFAYLLNDSLEVTAIIYDYYDHWYTIGFDAERNALIVGDDEDEDSEGKYGTRYIPLLSAEELVREADRVLEGYTPPEEVLERYGIM